MRYLIGVTILVLICIAIVIALWLPCYLRKTIIPTAPIYPDAVLNELVEDCCSSYYRIETYYYDTPASREEIKAFYETVGGSCEYGDSGNICIGSAKPFGEYYVYSYNNNFGLEIRWTRCSIYIP